MANDSIVIPGHSSPLREDRVGMHGRGVAIYVKDHIAVKRCVDFEYSACMVRTHVGSMQSSQFCLSLWSLLLRSQPISKQGIGLS